MAVRDKLGDTVTVEMSARALFNWTLDLDLSFPAARVKRDTLVLRILKAHDIFSSRVRKGK